MSTAFEKAIAFILPHETEFRSGHWGDWNFVVTENVPGEWDGHGLDALPEKLAIAAFDVWVNGGHANRWLQQAFNATHPDATSLLVDGVLGPKSLAALRSSEPDPIVREFLALREARFRALARTSTLAQFLKGWLQRNEDLRKLLLG